MPPTAQINSRTPLLAAQAASSLASSRSGSVLPVSSTRRTPIPARIRADRHVRFESTQARLIPLYLLLAMLASVAFVAWDVSALGNCYFSTLCDALGERERLDVVFWRNSGAYAPWRSLGKGGGGWNLPRGCEINQVSVLHRHASRYPTESGAERIRSALDKIRHREVHFPRGHFGLTFLTRADMNMTDWDFDNLTNMGRKAAWRSGWELADEYRPLIGSWEGMFSRASGQDRIEETAGYWLEGYYGQPFKLKHWRQLPKADLVIPEGKTRNNTLSVHNCPQYEDQPEAELDELLRLLEPARDKLNMALRPVPRLETIDLTYLADMCPFDSQHGVNDWTAWSRWCGLFDRDEWAILGHWRDTKRYYENGKGSAYGPTLGAGWVNELLARLTDSSPEDETTTNRTLDSDEQTFPRGGRRFFVDFSHDNEQISILSALNIRQPQTPLDTDSVPERRTWITAEIIPFGSRIVVERIGCDLGKWEPDPESPDDGKKNYVRIFVNDQLVPVEHIACQQSGLVEHGMCELAAFLDTQTWSRQEVDWGVCYADDN